MKTIFCFYSQRNYPLPRTAIEAEILFAAHIMQVRFLKRLSGKTPPEQSSSGKKIGAESAVLHFVFFVIIINKMQQSAKENCLLKRNTMPEVFPLTAGIAGSGKTVPFEKRRSRYKETAENKAEAYRVYVEHLFSACDAVDARIFSKGEETGLYYYGARYLDPKYSRWLSGDPALGEYIPSAGADPSKLAGMGGVYNTVNLHLYHYAGNNPVKYEDPDGMFDVLPYHIPNFQVGGPKLQKFTGVPLGGGYSQNQKDWFKIADILQASLGVSSLGDYQTLASLPSNDLKDTLIEVSKAIAGAISSSAGKIISLADLAKALFSTPEAKAQNYTKSEKEFLMMVGIEQSFISDLSTKLIEKGFPVHEKKDGNSNFIMNITITSFTEYTTSGILAKDAILLIADEVKASNELYKDIKINE